MCALNASTEHLMSREVVKTVARGKQALRTSINNTQKILSI